MSTPSPPNPNHPQQPGQQSGPAGRHPGQPPGQPPGQGYGGNPSYGPPPQSSQPTQQWHQPPPPNAPWGGAPAGPGGAPYGTAQNKSFFAKLFDLSFSEFITPSVVKIVYVLAGSASSGSHSPSRPSSRARPSGSSCCSSSVRSTHSSS